MVRPVSPLQGERLLEAMRREWPEAHIELLEFSRQPAPEGEIHFPRTSLHSVPTATAAGTLWTGWVQYGAAQRFSIWARVKVAIPVKRLVAVRELAAGRAIEAQDVQLAERDENPGLTPGLYATDPEQVVGKWPRQAIRAGETVRRGDLEEPKVVLRGDNVKVMVWNGGAKLELDGVAEGSGAVGETVLVRNPDSQRRFPARVEAKGRVTVDPARVNP